MFYRLKNESKQSNTSSMMMNDLEEFVSKYRALEGNRSLWRLLTMFYVSGMGTSVWSVSSHYP